MINRLCDTCGNPDARYFDDDPQDSRECVSCCMKRIESVPMQQWPNLDRGDIDRAARMIDRLNE